MNLTALPAFSDNYIWMLHDGRRAIVVDPGDAVPVTAALDALGLTLVAILVTHHHPDHVGGVDALRPRLLASAGQVWGPAREKIPLPCMPLNGGYSVEVMGLHFQVIDVPGHTAGHIAYFLPASEGREPILFCGDTLFSGGCGRLFEGTPAQMHQSLGRLAALPGDTRVCLRTNTPSPTCALLRPSSHTAPTWQPTPPTAGRCAHKGAPRCHPPSRKSAPSTPSCAATPLP